MARFLDGLGERTDDGLVGGEFGEVFEVFSEGLSRDGDAVARDDACFEEELKERGGAANVVEVVHDVFARRLEVREEGDAVRYGLEVVNGEFDADAVCHRNQVKNGVGGSSRNNHDSHGIFKCLSGHDVSWADVFLE